jgi:hypothetical protein
MCYANDVRTASAEGAGQRRLAMAQTASNAAGTVPSLLAALASVPDRRKRRGRRYAGKPREALALLGLL